jgi:hypothetical protein
VRGCDGQASAVANRQLRDPQRVLERRGTVIDARQDVEVQIDAGISGGRHAAEVVPAFLELEGGGRSRLVRSR